MYSVTYDAKLNLVEVDVSGTRPTADFVDQIFDAVIEKARRAPSRPIVMTCWSAVDLGLEAAKRYGERMEQLKPLIQTFVRYGDVEATTKAQLRTESIKHKLFTKVYFYGTRDEALAAIRRGEVS
jgi:hypothetical protein